MSFFNSLRYVPAAIGGAAVSALMTHYYGNASWPDAIVKRAPARSTPPIPWSEPEKYQNKPALFATGDTIFSFNINNGIFFASRNKNANATWARWLVSTPFSTRSIISDELSTNSNTPYLVSFTPHGDEFLILNHEDGTTSWKMHFNPCRYPYAPSYQSLTRWIRGNIFTSDDSHTNFNLVFGPGSSYFARTKTDCCYQDLPARLEEIICEKQKSHAEDEDPAANKHGWIPRIVALGAQETWVAVWTDGRAAWSLKNNCQLVKDAPGDDFHVPVNTLENIVLNPHNTIDYVSVTKFGHFDWHWNSSNGTSDTMIDISCQATQYQQMRAKEGNLSFTLDLRLGGQNSKILITPDTDWTDEKIRSVARHTPVWTRTIDYLLGR